MADHKALNAINQEVIQCRHCPRLIDHITRTSEQKVKRFRDWEYWGKPVPGFGDPEARLLIIGLAPAAHGANRTGRMFTGDQSGDWLYAALYDAGFSSQRESYAIDDGLALNDVYITAVCRCAPPQNKPTKAEIDTCTAHFLSREIEAMDQVNAVLCLGRVAFDTYRKMKGLKKVKFGHGAAYDIPGQPSLFASYHPSRQNTNTGKLLWKDWLQVFENLYDFLNTS